MYEVKMQHYAYASIEAEASNHDYSNGAETYQEDRAYANRLKKRHPRDYSVSDIQRLNRIAERGLEARFNIDKAISQVKVEMRGSEENGTYFDGIKNWAMYKKIIGMLEGLK